MPLLHVNITIVLYLYPSDIYSTATMVQPRDTGCDNRHVLSNSSTPYTDVVSGKKQPKKNHVKRPLNRFMLYSKMERPNVRRMHPDLNQRNISEMLGKKWKLLSPEEQQEYEKKADELKLVHESQYPDYKYRPKRRGTSTKKTIYFPVSRRRIQPAIHQSTQKPHRMSNTNPELNNYSPGSIPDVTDEATMFNIQNVLSEVPTDSSKSSTSDSPGMYMTKVSPFSGKITVTVDTNY